MSPTWSKTPKTGFLVMRLILCCNGPIFSYRQVRANSVERDWTAERASDCKPVISNVPAHHVSIISEKLKVRPIILSGKTLRTCNPPDFEHTVLILSFRTDMPGQTVQTSSLFRVYTVCSSLCIVWTHCSNFKSDYDYNNFLGCPNI